VTNIVRKNTTIAATKDDDDQWFDTCIGSIFMGVDVDDDWDL
jgi:hypothetical protein